MTFEVPYGDPLFGTGSVFPVFAEDDPERQVGTVTVDRNTATVEIDDDYVAERPYEVSGSFSFWLLLTRQYNEGERVDLEVGGEVFPWEFGPRPRQCPEDECPFDGVDPWKGGHLYNPDDPSLIRWQVGVPAPEEGMAPGQRVVVQEEFGPNQEIVQNDTYPRVLEASELRLDEGSGHWDPTYQEVPIEDLGGEWSEDGSRVEFATREGVGDLEGRFYLVQWLTGITDGGVSDSYTNTAYITVADGEPITVEDEYVFLGGEGIVRGTSPSAINLTKLIEGDVEVPADLEFEVQTTVAPEDGEPVVRDPQTVTADETITFDNLPPRSTVTIDEVLPTAPGGSQWGDPTLVSENADGETQSSSLPVDLELGIDIVGYGAAEVSLVNEAVVVDEPTYAVGDYTWIDENQDGLQDDDEPVLPGVTVNLYTPGDDEPVLVDSTVTDEDGLYLFDELPAGDYQVEFVLPEGCGFTIQNAQDGGSTLDSDAVPTTGWTVVFTLDGLNPELTLKYELQEFLASQGIDPTWDAGIVCAKAPPKEPGKPGEPGKPELPRTGGGVDAGVIALAVLLLGGGGALVWGSRRKSVSGTP